MSPSTVAPTHVLSAMAWPTISRTTKLAVVAMEIASHIDIISYGTCIARHNKIHDVLYNAAQYATLAPTKEAPTLNPSSCSCSADILLPHLCRDRLVALDVSVISPLQHLTLAGAASSPSHALHAGVQRKMSSNLPACRSAGVDFLPIVVETLGWWCSDGITNICSIGQALGQRLNSTYPVDFTKHLFSRLAVSLWRGNAGLWMPRQPTL